MWVNFCKDRSKQQSPTLMSPICDVCRSRGHCVAPYDGKWRASWQSLGSNRYLAWRRGCIRQRCDGIDDRGHTRAARRSEDGPPQTLTQRPPCERPARELAPPHLAVRRLRAHHQRAVAPCHRQKQDLRALTDHRVITRGLDLAATGGMKTPIRLAAVLVLISALASAQTKITAPKNKYTPAQDVE